ncbi:MAG: EamA family transporter RarD [Myxococcales bacterium]|nr:EamA family transporter RarD [Myxococcales bacterium]
MFSEPKESQHLTSGFVATLGAFTIWGFAPIFWRLCENFSSSELLSYRILFAMLITAIALLISGFQLKAIQSLKDWRIAITMALSTALITTNWFVFLWAVDHERVTEISLGYYTSPLLNVFLGRLLLNERLPPIQGLAVSIAGAGVLYLIWSLGSLPWVAMVLAASFSGYGLVRKRSSMPALPGLFIETTFCMPFCLGYLIFLADPPWGTLHSGNTNDLLLLGSAGLVTAVPLFLFSVGARQLPYSTIGMIQYLAPSLHLISAVFLFGETFTTNHVVTFACIWIAVLIYTASAVYMNRN